MGLFDEANLIAGMELLAVIQTAAGPTIPIGGKCVAFYVDSKTALGVLMKAGSGTIVFPY